MFHMLRRTLPLLRVVPVFSWSLSALAISVGFAVHDLRSASAVDWMMFGVLLLSVLLLQGVIQSVQEHKASGKSGSKAETARVKKTLSDRGLFVFGLLGLIGAVSFGIYAAKTASGSFTLFLLVGVWTALSYACHPFRYLSMLGEWYLAFPAITACTLGTYYILTDAWEPVIGWAAVLHSLLCVAWLMQYHLGDLTTARKAEKQRTTVAWAARKFGFEAARHVPAAYFLLTVLLGTMATLRVTHIFLLTVVCALLGAFNSWNTNLHDLRNVAGNQMKMITMTVLHAMALALWMAWT
ncbi:hypothetical protein OS242_18295 [Tumebacillus sp. DT12]|uniref:Prenyltransferase n=1 Tax=Tumebacillus lacus TaxID=2995335 RepID=A0ABT3X7N6_9BACL|nr:hypothetical protein [Tumebacillus lacus]MCX7571897.1 hypothetical protein [Tumebacillus lacus]